MHLVKTLAAGLALTVAATAFVDTADARHRRHGDTFAAGIFGFAAGALIGSALAPRYPYAYYDQRPRYRYYEEPRYYDEPAYYYQPAPRAYYPAPERYYNSPCNSPGSKPAWAMC